MSGIERIAAERQRQISEEGWTPEHDAGHIQGELALAACCYAMPVQLYQQNRPYPLAHAGVYFCDPWPWQDRWDKRKQGGNVPRLASTTDERIDWLTKAGALIAAEIDRLVAAEGEQA